MILYRNDRLGYANDWRCAIYRKGVGDIRSAPSMRLTERS